MKNYDDITIRSIQQYLYCKHRFGLIHIDCQFEHNVHTYKGKLAHQNIDLKKGVKSRGVMHENSVKVYYEDEEVGWNIYGVIDCLEFRQNKEGVYISKYDDFFNITIVEYKVTAPKDKKERYEDKMQLLAQKICIDKMFQTDTKTYFYYKDTKKRVSAEFVEADYIFLKETIQNIKIWLEKQEIPPYDRNQNCSGCSMKNICLPKKKKDRI